MRLAVNMLAPRSVGVELISPIFVLKSSVARCRGMTSAFTSLGDTVQLHSKSEDVHIMLSHMMVLYQG